MSSTENGSPRHMLWRQQYRARRYCRHLTQDELDRRLRDIVLNMLNLDSTAKISLIPLEDGGGIWMEIFTHALEEMVMRHGPYPNGFTRNIFHREPFPNFANELASKASEAMARRNLKPGEVFIKYGKVEHMKNLIEEGSMLVRPASYYKSPDHNGAIRDDELSLSIALALDRDDIVRIVKNPEDVPLGPLDQRVDVKIEGDADYWLYCLTTSVNPRLFVDFNADACVIIKDKERFTRLLSEAGNQYFPNTVLRHGKAVYIDPVLPKNAAIDIPISKHFGYAYQDEYRFMWHPRHPARQLPDVKLELGPLSAYAQLIVL